MADLLDYLCVSSRSDSPALFLIVDMPAHIAARQMEIDPVTDIFLSDLGGSGGAEGMLVDTKKSFAILTLRREPQQGSEREPVHHAETAMPVGRERQRLDVI